MDVMLVTTLLKALLSYVGMNMHTMFPTTDLPTAIIDLPYFWATYSGNHPTISFQFADSQQAQARWELSWDAPNVGTIKIVLTYRVNVAVNTANLDTWRPGTDATLETRYSATGGRLSYTISVNGRDISGEVPLAPGTEVGPLDYDVLPLTKLRLYFSVKVFAETVTEGATPRTFNGEVPTATTFSPRSNIALTTTFYIAPTIRAEVTVLGKTVAQKEFPLQRHSGAVVSLKINRVILVSNCGNWNMLTARNPPYDPPRELASNGTKCVLSKTLGETSTAMGYELRAEYINLHTLTDTKSATTAQPTTQITTQPLTPSTTTRGSTSIPATSTATTATASESWEPPPLVIYQITTTSVYPTYTSATTQRAQADIWQITLWTITGLVAFTAAYLLTSFIFSRQLDIKP